MFVPGKLKEVVGRYREALKIDLSNVMTYNKTGHCPVNKGEIELAGTDFSNPH